MERVRLQFWNALGYLSTFLSLLCAVLVGLQFAGWLPDRLQKFLDFPINPYVAKYLPPGFQINLLLLILGAIVFALLAFVAGKQKKLWRPLGLQPLPAPGGGYFQKISFSHLKPELKEAVPQARRQARKFFNDGERHFGESRYQAAATAYQKATFAFPTMSAFLNLGVCLCYRSSFQKAMDAFQIGLAISRRNKDEAMLSAFFCNMGIPQREQGNLADALASFKQAYGIAETTGNVVGRLCGHGNLGSLLLLQGRPDEALKPWQISLADFQKNDYPVGLAVALDNLGRVRSALGDYRLALDYHAKAWKIYKTVQNIPGQTQALANIGYVYLKLGKRRKSFRFNREALRLAGFLNSSIDRARAHSNISLVHEKKGKLGEALQSTQKALELYEKCDNPLGMANQLLHIGAIYTLQRKRNEALRKLGEARAKFLRSGLTNDAVEAAIERALREKPSRKSSRKSPKNILQTFFPKKDTRLPGSFTASRK